VTITEQKKVKKKYLKTKTHKKIEEKRKINAFFPIKHQFIVGMGGPLWPISLREEKTTVRKST